MHQEQTYEYLNSMPRRVYEVLASVDLIRQQLLKMLGSPRANSVRQRSSEYRVSTGFLSGLEKDSANSDDVPTQITLEQSISFDIVLQARPDDLGCAKLAIGTTT